MYSQCSKSVEHDTCIYKCRSCSILVKRVYSLYSNCRDVVPPLLSVHGRWIKGRQSLKQTNTTHDLPLWWWWFDAMPCPRWLTRRAVLLLLLRALALLPICLCQWCAAMRCRGRTRRRVCSGCGPAATLRGAEFCIWFGHGIGLICTGIHVV